MKLSYDIFQKLYGSCIDCVISIDREEMLFQEVGNFNIRFALDINDADIYEEDYVRPDDLDIQEWLKKYDIKKLRVDCDETIEEKYNGNKAYRTMLAIFLRHINNVFEDAVCNSCVGYIEYISEPLCDDYLYGYGFMVCIKEAYWNITKFYDWLIREGSRHYQVETVPTELDNVTGIPNYDVSIISTNTKARRLGYIKLILNEFKRSDVLPELVLLRRINDSANNYETDLKKYKNNKGVIIASKTGSSAKPYIELEQDFHFLNKNLQLYQIGKTAKAYLQSMDFCDNKFELNIIDKTFFLKSILSYDYVYQYIIMYYAFINKNCSYEDLKSKFRDYVIKYLDDIINQPDNEVITSSSILKIKDIIDRIKKWQKPDKYLEHVLMPRINWLYDLDIIELNKDLTFTLTAAGRKLFGCLTILHDLSRSSLCGIANYLNKVYMQIVNIIYDLNLRKFEGKDSERLYEMTEQSFELFKTLAGNRVTLSTLTTYLQLQMESRLKIAIDTNDVVSIINNDNRYILKFQSYYSDGYIQRR